MTQNRTAPTRSDPRPQPDAPAPQQIAWLLRLGTWGRAYWPLGADRYVPTGMPLPFKRLVDPETGFIRGRMGYLAEERSARDCGALPDGERLVLLHAYPKRPGSPSVPPEQYDEIWRMTPDELEELLAHPSIDHERAAEFSPRCLASRFSRCRPYCLTTMCAERVPWAAVAVHFPMPVARNLQRLLHFRKSEALDQLVQLGGMFYAAPMKPHGDAICYFVAFREPIPTSQLQPLRRTVASAFSYLRPTRITCSFPEHLGDTGCVPGPCSGSLFAAGTGRTLPDEAWSRTPLVAPALLSCLNPSRSTQELRGPTFPQIAEIIDACGLEPSSRWGFRDPWVEGKPQLDGTSSRDPRFALVIPGKQYGPPDAPFTGENLSAELYHDQLRRGREFFANTFGQGTPRWLCVDFDVKPQSTNAQSSTRFEVDKAWLLAHINHEEVDRWRNLGLHPEFRISGRGFYVELFFAKGVPEAALRKLSHRCARLLKADKIEVGFRKRQHLTTSTGYIIIEDVSSLSHLVRMPGSVHHSTGVVSMFLDGGLTPSRARSCPEAASRMVAEAVTNPNETPSIDTLVHVSPPSLPPEYDNQHQDGLCIPPPPQRQDAPMLSEEGNDSVAPSAQHVQESSTSSIEVDVGSLPFAPLIYMRDGHLMLNAAQRAALVRALVRDLLQRQHKRRGPVPDRIPYDAAASCLVNQACRTSLPFRLGTRQIQSRISELAGKPERSRNRASRAVKALVEAGYISLVKGHQRRGEEVAGAGPCPVSEVATYKADIQRLLAMFKSAAGTSVEERVEQDSGNRSEARPRNGDMSEVSGGRGPREFGDALRLRPYEAKKTG